MEKVDTLIEYLCDYIKSISEEKRANTPDIVAENVNALAGLVAARAQLQAGDDIPTGYRVKRVDGVMKKIYD